LDGALVFVGAGICQELLHFYYTPAFLVRWELRKRCVRFSANRLDLNNLAERGGHHGGGEGMS
jgi:hypothetical protein